MKYFLVLLALSAHTKSNILGSWKYVGFIYDGQQYTPPDPALDLRFHFQSNGISILKWFWLGSDGFCEREAIYIIENGNLLKQKTTWVNSANEPSCSKDPDMRLGADSETPFTVESDHLNLELQIDDKKLIYVLEKIEKNQ